MTSATSISNVAACMWECGRPADDRREKFGPRLCSECWTEKAELEATRRKAWLLRTFIERGFPARAVPSLSADVTTDQAKAWAAVLEVLAGKRPGVYCFGEVGCGKTSLVSRAGIVTLAAGVGSMFTTAVRFLQRITASYSDARCGERTEDVVTEMATVPLLVLDDLGTERATEHNVGRLFEVIDARYSAFRPTLITSNHSLPKLAEHLARGDDALQARRIADRLRELCVPAPLSGASLRATRAPNFSTDVQRVMAAIPSPSPRRGGHPPTPAFNRRFSEVEGLRKPTLDAWEIDAAALVPEWIEQAAGIVDRNILAGKYGPARRLPEFTA